MKMRHWIGIGATALVVGVLLAGCGNVRKLHKLYKNDSTVGLKLPIRSGQVTERVDTIQLPKVVSYKKQDGSEVFFAPVALDSLTGEKLMSVNIDEVTISTTNRRNVAERNGKILLEFIVTVPEGFQHQAWQLLLSPQLKKGPNMIALDPLVYSGYRFRTMQEREYDRYDAYVNRIVDPMDYFDQFGDKTQYERYQKQVAAERTKYENQYARLSTLTPDQAEMDSLVGWITPRERERQSNLLRRYVQSSDRKVARYITYASDENDELDHLNDYLTPRFRYSNVDVLSGGQIYTRVYGQYPNAVDRIREGYAQTVKNTPETMRNDVRMATSRQLGDFAAERLIYTGSKRPMIAGLVREMTDSARRMNYAALQSVTEGQLELLNMLDTITVRNNLMDWGKIARNEELAADTSMVFQRLVRNPYSHHAKLDTTIYRVDGSIQYFYTQEVAADENTSHLNLFLHGKVEDRNGRTYRLQKTDTLTFNIASMTTFIDETPRYMQRIVLRDAEANARFFFTFPLGKSVLNDTLAVNRRQLAAVRNLTRDLMTDPIYIIDSITLRATSSPEGSLTLNNRLAKERAEALRRVVLSEFRLLYDSLNVSHSVAFDNKGKQVVAKTDDGLPDLPNLLRVEWLAEDWDRLRRLIEADPEIENKEEIFAVFAKEKDLDKRESRIRAKHKKAYARISEVLYPQMRAVDFRFNLHRRGMLQDTVYTTELDSSYLHAVELLKKRRYDEALTILRPYEDRNTALAYMSLGYDAAAYRILRGLPESASTADLQYMLAILAARIGDEEQAVRYFLHSTELRENLKFRGNLDPEISYLIVKYGLLK